MGPTFVLLPWIHGAFLLALAFVGLAAIAADAIAAYQAKREQHARNRAHRIAQLHADAHQVGQGGEIEA